jgi:hypothetical protein
MHGTELPWFRLLMEQRMEREMQLKADAAANDLAAVMGAVGAGSEGAQAKVDKMLERVGRGTQPLP